ncbi:hypothetical protein Ae201684P_011530 [Aphanomyces euteiches]|nr:hypothetical protein Ae201684P_011530 [Aphanomyces euteiches]
MVPISTLLLDGETSASSPLTQNEQDQLTGEDISFLCNLLSPPSAPSCDDILLEDVSWMPRPSCSSPSTDAMKKVCAEGGCHKRVRSRGLCKAHGGGRRCTVEGCIKSSQGRGLCIRHGGGRRCEVNGCSRGAQSSGKCKNHGGGIRCREPGCSKSSQGAGYCRSHGGGKLCKYPGCKKGSQRKGFCATHGNPKTLMATSITI